MLRRIPTHTPASSPPLGQAGCFSSPTANCGGRSGYVGQPVAGGTYRCCPNRGLDPTVDIALTTASQILSRNDPGVGETEQLIRRIIMAPPAPWSGRIPGAGPTVAKVSDINPFLRPIAYVSENPVTTVLGLVAVPLIAFLLGRATARPAPRAQTT